MSHRLQFLADKPIVELDRIDSTNNYAMRLIDADTAQDGMTITAREQTEGKGQRGRQWVGLPGESIMMSMIIAPKLAIEDQFVLCAGTALAVAESLEDAGIDRNIYIKWTNDIIVDDKKTGGILIENVLRGNNWNYAVIGLGLNVRQREFPPELPHATSLKIVSGKEFDMVRLRDMIRENIFRNLSGEITPDILIEKYNQYLFRKDKMQTFSDEGREWQARVEGVTREGKLQVLDETGEQAFYTHGVVNWVMGA